jgi:hypothetical protein
MTEPLNPESFDFNDWFSDANLPEASADIFTNAGVLGELEELQRRIDTEARVTELEPTAGSKKSTLEDEYVALAEKFTASKVTVYVRALTLSERKAIRKAHDAALKAKQEGDEGYLIRCIAASVVGMKRPGQARVPAKLTVGQVKDLHKRIGEAQTAVLFQAFQQATNATPAVDADFLRRLSGPIAGPES